MSQWAGPGKVADDRIREDARIAACQIDGLEVAVNQEISVVAGHYGAPRVRVNGVWVNGVQAHHRLRGARTKLRMCHLTRYACASHTLYVREAAALVSSRFEHCHAGAIESWADGCNFLNFF
jgi:hypothetical protein